MGIPMMERILIFNIISREPQNDWFDWLIKETKNVTYAKRVLLKSIKSLFKRIDSLY